jgi:ABC-type transporter Mla MlaB component
VKFRDLFSKQAPDSIKNVRSTSQPTIADREATARKIDAIESEITAELGGYSDAENSTDSEIDSEVAIANNIEQCIYEASILYANQQPNAAASLLLEALAQASYHTVEPVAWQMLLELASIDRDQARFEALALRYAERFETSPPQWHTSHQTHSDTLLSTPMLAFRGKLLGSSAPALAQLEQAAAAHSKLAVDLYSITELDIAGCSALLALLSRWHQEGKHTSVAYSPTLIEMLRAQLQQGRPDGNDAAWRLLIELIRVSGDEVSYEDACVAYCLTYEVSPPAPVGLAMHQAPPVADLMLPEQISYPVDALLESLRTSAKPLDHIVLNCHELRLIEFNAAAPLLAGITEMARGKTVEWREMLHLTSTLLQLISGEGKLKISHRLP